VGENNVNKRCTLSGLLLAFVGLLCNSCSNSLNAPAQGVTGQWSGTLKSNIGLPSNGFNVDFFEGDSKIVVSPGLMMPGLQCDTPSESATGQISGNNISFIATMDNATYSFTGTVSADNTSMSGTFKQTGNLGSNCPGGDNGSWSLQIFPNFSGTYSGPATTSDPQNANQAIMNANISEGSNFLVSIGLSVTNSACFSAGSFTGTAVGNVPPTTVGVGYSIINPGQPCDSAYGSGSLTRVSQ
jgi:hypothetical protein